MNVERVTKILDEVDDLEAGDLPSFLESSHSEYAQRIFVNALKKIQPKSEEEIIEMYEELKGKENPVTSSDGSRGQWFFCQKRKLKTIEWYLKQVDSDYSFEPVDLAY